MELNIDGKPCDLGTERIAVPGYDAAALADVEAAREGRSLTLTIPATPRNDALAGFARDPHTAERFNAAPHTAELTAEGSVMLKGAVRMLSASDEGYRIEIRDGGAGWAKNAARRAGTWLKCLRNRRFTARQTEYLARKSFKRHRKSRFSVLFCRTKSISYPLYRQGEERI